MTKLPIFGLGFVYFTRLSGLLPNTYWLLQSTLWTHKLTISTSQNKGSVWVCRNQGWRHHSHHRHPTEVEIECRKWKRLLANCAFNWGWTYLQQHTPMGFSEQVKYLEQPCKRVANIIEKAGPEGPIRSASIHVWMSMTDIVDYVESRGRATTFTRGCATRTANSNASSTARSTATATRTAQQRLPPPDWGPGVPPSLNWQCCRNRDARGIYKLKTLP